MNYMGHTQPPRENPSLQFAIEQGGYLAPSETQLRFQARLTDSLAQSETSLVSTRDLSPNRQSNSALPSISPHQPTFAHLPLSLIEQFKDTLTVKEDDRSEAQKELEKSAASPKLIVLIHFLEKHGGPKKIPENATSPLDEVPIIALKGLYGEQIWALRNLVHNLPNLLLPCQNLSALIKKTEQRQHTLASYGPLSLAPLCEEISISKLCKKLLTPLKKGTKLSPLACSLSLLLISLQEKSENSLLNLQTLQKIESKLAPLFFEDKKELNPQGLLLLFALTGIIHLQLNKLSADLGEEERAKEIVLAGFTTGFISQLTKTIYAFAQKEPMEVRIPLQITAIVIGLLELLLAAPYFDNLDPQLIRNCLPAKQTALFSDSAISITKTTQLKQPELARVLQKCHDIVSKEMSARDILLKLERHLLPFFDLDRAALKNCAEASSSFVKELLPLYSLS